MTATRMMRLRWIFGLAALASSTAQASNTTETPVPNIPPLKANDHFGDKVKACPDLNGDGRPDMLIRNPFFDLVSPAVTDLGKFTSYGFGIFGGIVLVKDFPPQFTLATPLTPGFASDFDAIGDINADGKPDIAVGWPTQVVFGFRGQVLVLSGANGSFLRRKEGPPGIVIDYGTAVAGLGDISGDGILDLAVSAPKFDVPSATGNYVEILSTVPAGITTDVLTTLRFFTPTSGEARFGQNLVAADTDGNGKRNLIIASTGDLSIPNSAGFRIVDPSIDQGAQSIVSVLGDPVAGFARAIAAADIDGDGKAEIAVGSPDEVNPSSGLATGSLRVYNAQGALLHVYYGSVAGEKFGGSVSAGPDFDADGKPDWAVGCPGIHSIKIVNSFPLAGTTPMYSYGSANPDAFGTSIASADFDGNGIQDLLVGAPDANGAALLQGRASVVTATCDGTVTNYGQGCAPVGGSIPALNALGCPTGSGNLTLRLQNGIPNALAVLVFGTQQAAVPVGGGGCQLLVTPLSPFTINVFLNAAGEANLLFPVPAILQGLDITTQAFVSDSSSLAGFDSSNGVHIKVGI